MTFRSRKLLDAARECPRCMGCGKHSDGDVVMAHANWAEYGKGIGHKAHDWAVAALCCGCHAYVDTGRASREERKAFWQAAHVRTQAWLFESGKVVVA